VIEATLSITIRIGITEHAGFEAGGWTVDRGTCPTWYGNVHDLNDQLLNAATGSLRIPILLVDFKDYGSPAICWWSLMLTACVVRRCWINIVRGGPVQFRPYHLEYARALVRGTIRSADRSTLILPKLKPLDSRSGTDYKRCDKAKLGLTFRHAPDREEPPWL
jgi:hypothetical protein